MFRDDIGIFCCRSLLAHRPINIGNAVDLREEEVDFQSGFACYIHRFPVTNIRLMAKHKFSVLLAPSVMHDSGRSSCNLTHENGVSCPAKAMKRTSLGRHAGLALGINADDWVF